MRASAGKLGLVVVLTPASSVPGRSADDKGCIFNGKNLED
jgi:hypothetical protein